MSKRIPTAFILFVVLSATALICQTQTPAPAQNTPAAPPASSPQAKASDVDSVEHIVAALYDVISGPPGGRDWDRFHSLFYPGAKLVPTRRGQDGKISARILSPDEYIERVKPIFEKQGFFESSVANRIELWDRIAHVWTTYESRHAKAEKPFARGINSIQLVHDGSRWWVLNVFWEGEEPEHPLPEKYLK